MLTRVANKMQRGHCAVNEVNILSKLNPNHGSKGAENFAFQSASTSHHSKTEDQM